MQTNSDISAICPECFRYPRNLPYVHCSRACALAARRRYNEEVDEYSNDDEDEDEWDDDDYDDRSSRRAPTIGTMPSRSRLCPTCKVNPSNPGFVHCSKQCANGISVAEPATPRKHIKICPNCAANPPTPGYRFCSPKCDREASLSRDLDKLSIAAGVRRKCMIRGCRRKEYKAGSKYCGDTCRARGVTLKLEAACLRCRAFPKVDGSAFCGHTCRSAVSAAAPLLLQIPKDDPTFTIVSNQFSKEWKHPTATPNVYFLYRIVMDSSLRDTFDRKLEAIERQHDFKSQRMLPANERRRWHGTRRECAVGDNGSTQMCTSPTCSLCVIMKKSFDVQYCRAGCMFGKGIYTSGTSSKSDGYVHQTSNSSYKAMLLTRVLAGNAAKLTQADHTLTKPPINHDSVRGVPGTNLMYDELIVYDNDSIRPFYLVIYG